MIEIPRLETGRLILRGQRLEDFEDSATLWADPDVARHIGGRPSTRDESWARFQRNLGHWALMGYGLWAVIEKDTGAYVGEIGMADFKRPIEPPLPKVPEFGWVLARRAWGKGYASEAVAAAIDWAQGRFGPTPLVCIIAPANAASLKVAERAGFRETRRAAYHDAETVVLERPAGPAT